MTLKLIEAPAPLPIRLTLFYNIYLTSSDVFNPELDNNNLWEQGAEQTSTKFES